MSNSSGNSSGDEKQSAPKSHLGIFRNLSSQSISKSNKADQQKSSSMSTHSASSSLHIPSGPRATLSGKKKPPSWGS
jgi:hypothetical protein